MSYRENIFPGVLYGLCGNPFLGVVKRDTRSLGYGPYIPITTLKGLRLPFDNPRVQIHEPPPLNRDHNREPKAIKRRGLLIMGLHYTAT